MTIEADLRAYLLSQPNLKSMIDTRLYPLVLPQPPTFPAVTYAKVSHSHVRDLSGVAYSISRFQFSCFAATYSGAKAVANEIKRALQDFVGVVGGYRFLDADGANEIDIYESDSGIYHVPVDVIITYKGDDSK